MHIPDQKDDQFKWPRNKYETYFALFEGGTRELFFHIFPRLSHLNVCSLNLQKEAGDNECAWIEGK